MSQQSHESNTEAQTVGHDIDLDTIRIARDRRASLPPLKEEPNWEYKVVDTPGALRQLAKKLSKEKLLAVDTETYGLGEEALNARLALIQIGIPKISRGKYLNGAGQTYLVDVVKLQKTAEEEELKTGKESNPLEPLRELLENEKQLKIVQHAQFEEDQFDRYGIKMQGVEDTEVLAKELRPRLISHALNALSAELVGYSLSKDEQKSDWGRRPLSKSQINYAAMDPEVTFEVWYRLKRDQQRVEVPENAGFDNLSAELLKEHNQQLFLVRPIADELFPAQLRMARRRGIIAQALRAAAEAEEDTPKFRNEELGSASIVHHPRTEPNLKKLRERLPDIAEQVIHETASRKDVEESLRALEGMKAGEAKKEGDKLFPEVGHTEQKLSIAIDFSDFYNEDDAIVALDSKWNEKELRNEALASNYSQRIAKAPALSLTVTEDEEGEQKLVIGLPRSQKGRITRGPGTSLVITEKTLKSMSADSSFLTALREKLADPKAEILSLESKSINKFLKAFDTGVGDGGVELASKMQDLRPDMYHFTLRSCCAELTCLLPDPDSAADNADALFRIHRKLSALDRLAEPEQEFSNSKDWQLIVAEQLSGMLDDMSESMRLLRYLDGEYDLSLMRGQNLLEGIRDFLIKESNDEKGTFSEISGPVQATISSRAKRELDLRQLKESFPKVAELVVREKINKRELDAVLKNFGRAFKEKIEEDIYDVVGEGSPTIGIWPKYNRVYKV